MPLPLSTLRAANKRRLPQFKNKHGVPAHSSPDGSDWNPAQWLQAFVGEVGEFCRARIQYEQGQITHEEYAVQAAKELADMQTYLDLLALRCLDVVKGDGVAGTLPDAAGYFMEIVANLGEYANNRKKMNRGDYTPEQFHFLKQESLFSARVILEHLHKHDSRSAPLPVVTPHPTGVDLDTAVVDKFNEVSNRVGARVFLHRHGSGISVLEVAPDHRYDGALPPVCVNEPREGAL